MDTVVKQRVLGVIVLVALLGFCLTVLLRGNKTREPHLAQINTHPPITQTTSALVDNTAENLTPVQSSGGATTPPATSTDTKTATSTNTTTGTAADLSPPSGVSVGTTTNTPSANPASQGSTTTLQTTTSPQTLPTSTVTQGKNTKTTTASSLPAANLNLAEASSTRASYPDATQTQAAETNTSTTSLTSSSTTTASSVPATSSHHHKVVHAAAKSSHPASTHAATSSSAGEGGLVVQVGTFTVRANAETLVDTLRKKGFTATAQQMTTSKGEMTRVIVGGKGLSQGSARTLQTKLEKTMNLKGFIVSHSKTPALTSTRKAKAETAPTTETTTTKTKKTGFTLSQAITIPQEGH